MLTLISFVTLGIWTALLGFMNNTVGREISFTKTTHDLHLPPIKSIDQDPKTHKSEIEILITPSETLKAFKNLWKEIFYGV